ncbi:MAG: Lipoyl synthase [Chlamydiia bacterium]|nr:Lipoyl synthase [Chlamydiia bacterium]
MVDLQAFDTTPKVKKAPKLNKLPPNPEGEESGTLGRFPKWLHRKLPPGKVLESTQETLKKHRLHTVCEEAKCPNQMECFSNRTATFLVLGSACTRSCGFCDIDFAKHPAPPEADEPERIAATVAELGLKHVVITMVARDDLPDKGAAHLVEIMQRVRNDHPTCTIELLTSDFLGDHRALDLILEEEPEVFNHNLETTRSLTPRVRHTATYERSLEVLSYVKASKKAHFVKSGLMVGLGETSSDVEETLSDLQQTGLDIVTIGQYLQASEKKLRVKEFVTPAQFEAYEKYGHQIGIPHMYCGPFVRSSYNADLLTQIAYRKNNHE